MIDGAIKHSFSSSSSNTGVCFLGGALPCHCGLLVICLIPFPLIVFAMIMDGLSFTSLQNTQFRARFGSVGRNYISPGGLGVGIRVCATSSSHQVGNIPLQI